MSERKSSERVFRGGSWGFVASVARCSERDGDEAEFRYVYLGLRVRRRLR